jgi:hypothetical protein
MNKILKILLAILAGCDVVIRIMTPLAVVLFWAFFFGLDQTLFTFFIIIGGLASLFRGIKIGFIKND